MNELEDLTEIKLFKLKQDIPADVDGFDGRGHDRTAGALASAIVSLSKRDGAIGLEGEWGAGKSSVIEMASSKLQKAHTNKDDRYNVFCFDLWAQNSENLKRSFLVELLNWAGGANLLSKKETKSLEDKIRDGSRTITYQVDRELPVIAFFAIMLLPALTLLLAWLGPVAFNEKVTAPNFLLEWSFGEDIAFSPAWIIPVLYLLIIFGLLIKAWFAPNKNEKKSETYQSKLYRTVAIFEQKSEDRRVTEDYREEDPASTEFQRHFRKIIHKIQSKNSNRVVIVFDNIDRMPNDEMLYAWREVRSIFSSAGEYAAKIKGGEGAYTVTAVIPYDRRLIREAAQQKSKPHSGSEKITLGTQGSYSDGDELIRKTLDIALRVSPPLTTDWQPYLDASLKKSIPELSNETRLKLFRILDAKYIQKGGLPTPRQINSFVNELTVLHSQWSEIIPVCSIAIYITHRDIIGKGSRNHASPMIDPRAEREANDDKLAEHLAAITFNVSPDRSLQVLLVPPVRAAVLNRDEIAVSALSAQTGFENALREVYGSHFDLTGQQFEPQDISNAAHILSTLSSEKHNWPTLWSLLGSAMQSMRDGRSSQLLSYSDISKIVARMDGAAKQSALTYLTGWFAKTCISKEADAQDMETYLEFFDSFLDDCDETDRKKNKELFDLASLDTDDESIQAAALKSHELNNFTFSDLPLKYDTTKLNVYLSELFWSDARSIKSLIGIEDGPLSAKAISLGLTQVAQSLRDADNKMDVTKEPINLLVALHKYDDLSKNELLTNLVNDGVLVAYHGRALAEKDYITAANLLFLMTRISTLKEIVERPPMELPVLGNNGIQQTELQKLFNEGSQSEDYLSRLTSLCTTEAQGIIVRNALSDNAYELCIQLTRRFINDEGGLNLYTEDFFKKYQKVLDIMDQEGDANVAERVSGHYRHLPGSFKEWQWMELPVVVLKDGKRVNSEANNLAFNALDDWLNSLDGEDLESLFTEQREGVEHYHERLISGGLKPKPAVLRDALAKTLGKSVVGNQTVADLTMLSDIASVGLKGRSYKPFVDSFIAKLADGSVQSDTLINIFSDFPKIVSHLDFSKKPDILVTEVLVRLVESDLDTAIEVIKKRQEDWRVLAHSQERYFEQVTSSLEAVEAGDEIAQERAKALRALLDIEKIEADDKPKKEQEE
jgi:hypothetical protein